MIMVDNNNQELSQQLARDNASKQYNEEVDAGEEYYSKFDEML